MHQMARARVLCSILFAAALSLVSSGCSDEPQTPDESPTLPPRLEQNGSLAVQVVLPAGAGTGLMHAGQDMSSAFAAVVGLSTEPSPLTGAIADAPGQFIVVAEVDVESEFELGDQGYAITSGQLDETHYGLRVTAATEVGAMYGLYQIVADLGVRYHHPEESFFPSNPGATLPWGYDGSVSLPRFELRGFHEHTQHPIVYSDFYLRPDEGFEPYLERYVLWLARNRQNLASWEMLKTVDLDSWLPYITEFVDMAHEYGIRVGWVGSFVDQQQNAFKHIEEEAVDDDGDPIPAEIQIAASLDRLAVAGFDYLTFQIGSSEFTKPADEDVLEWLNFAAAHLGAMDPPVDMYAWIHTTCDLESDDGGYFFHIPLEADPAVGAWVHTTMFYDLEHPAPVYSCENFHQQVDFLEAANGERAQIYFPETAWWLGFDNNMPLALPLTGWTRQNDIQSVLPDYDVEGHVTFTSGREWSYWMYDHYLTRVTWDGNESWEDYLTWIGPMFGGHEDTAVEALGQWTELQRQHFLEDNPLIYFYLAGERTQDEVGELAGILARRPKLSYRTVINYDEETFADWVETDLDMLEEMLEAYSAVLQTLSAPSGTDESLSETLYSELYEGLQIFVHRIEHSLALYRGVSSVREWHQQVLASETPDEDLRSRLLDDANDHLAEAESITADVALMLEAAEGRYRYPIELLARDKPETLTAYPFGYLSETSNAHFWTRRDAQLEDLIGQVFETIPEEWNAEPDQIFVTDADHVELIIPEHPLAGDVITGFMPQMLFGLTGFDDDSATPTMSFAQDNNANGLPDPLSEQAIAGAQEGDSWTGSAEVFTLTVHNSTGAVFGELLVLHPEFNLSLERVGETVANIEEALLDGAVPGENMVELVAGISGIDEAGATNLVKNVFGISPTDELPAELPISFRFSFEPEN